MQTFVPTFVAQRRYCAGFTLRSRSSNTQKLTLQFRVYNFRRLRDKFTSSPVWLLVAQNIVNVPAEFEFPVATTVLLREAVSRKNLHLPSCWTHTWRFSSKQFRDHNNIQRQVFYACLHYFQEVYKATETKLTIEQAKRLVSKTRAAARSGYSTRAAVKRLAKK